MFVNFDNPCPLPSGMFEVDDIAAYRKLLAHVPDGGKIVEIGVFAGKSLCSIGPLAKARGIRMYAVDSWMPYESCDMERAYAEFTAGLRRFHIEECVTVCRGDSAVMANSFTDGFFDLIFIDADHHYDAVKLDIQLWLKKLTPGGWIGGHNYHEPMWPGVTRAVDEIFERHDLRPHSIGGLVWGVQPEVAVPMTYRMGERGKPMPWDEKRELMRAELNAAGNDV